MHQLGFFYLGHITFSSKEVLTLGSDVESGKKLRFWPHDEAHLSALSSRVVEAKLLLVPRTTPLDSLWVVNLKIDHPYTPNAAQMLGA